MHKPRSNGCCSSSLHLLVKPCSRPNAKAEKPRPASLASGSEGLSQAACYTTMSYWSIRKWLCCHLKVVFINNVSWTIGSDHSYPKIMLLQNSINITQPSKVLCSGVLEPRYCFPFLPIGRLAFRTGKLRWRLQIVFEPLIV